ncbi:MAG TPA: Mut7-C RNAse domain-containing protein [Terriglobia bacterium]|nr:Mut7-C RNAse domain-containing protein [Terriglobia bacterium]
MIRPGEIRFAVDRHLGRLARLLRLVGYDTLYSPTASVGRLKESAAREERAILTRGRLERRFTGVPGVVGVRSAVAAEQLREVVEHFGLDTHAGLWTRCTLCNGVIEKVAKASVESELDPKIFNLYEEFFRCASCRHLYWRGSHVDRILENLKQWQVGGGNRE